MKELLCCLFGHKLVRSIRVPFEFHTCIRCGKVRTEYWRAVNEQEYREQLILEKHNREAGRK